MCKSPFICVSCWSRLWHKLRPSLIQLLTSILVKYRLVMESLKFLSVLLISVLVLISDAKPTHHRPHVRLFHFYNVYTVHTQCSRLKDWLNETNAKGDIFCQYQDAVQKISKAEEITKKRKIIKLSDKSCIMPVPDSGISNQTMVNKDVGEYILLQGNKWISLHWCFVCSFAVSFSL